MKTYNMIFRFLIVFIGINSQLYSQNGFKGSLVLGMTASQLGGDSISGYDKLGLTAGLKLTYPINRKFDMNMELLFTQRGSRESLGFSSNTANSTSLNYLELPIYITINDWYIEKEDYHKVGAFVGLSYAYLFSVKTSNNLLIGKENDFTKNDLSGRIGIYYSFTKSLTFRTYYTDSFIKVLGNDDLFRTDSLDSLYWTFRMDYNF